MQVPASPDSCKPPHGLAPRGLSFYGSPPARCPTISVSSRCPVNHETATIDRLPNRPAFSLRSVRYSPVISRSANPVRSRVRHTLHFARWCPSMGRAMEATRQPEASLDCRRHADPGQLAARARMVAAEHAEARDGYPPHPTGPSAACRLADCTTAPHHGAESDERSRSRKPTTLAAPRSAGTYGAAQTRAVTTLRNRSLRRAAAFCDLCRRRAHGELAKRTGRDRHGALVPLRQQRRARHCCDGRRLGQSATSTDTERI
ncbi:hypothetical protein LMG24076_04696 [Trinickia soli]|nr:hypothetical protein LMG24076_04696 [Trinickia soli]